MQESLAENFGSNYANGSLNLRTEQKVSLEELIKEIEADEANLKPINRPPKPSQFIKDLKYTNNEAFFQ